MVVGGEGVDPLRICERELRAEVALAGDEFGEGVAAVVAGEHHVDDGACKGFDLADDARASLVEHEHDGFAGGCECLHECGLIGREVKVVGVAGSLAV